MDGPSIALVVLGAVFWMFLSGVVFVMEAKEDPKERWPVEKRLIGRIIMVLLGPLTLFLVVLWWIVMAIVETRPIVKFRRYWSQFVTKTPPQ